METESEFFDPKEIGLLIYCLNSNFVISVENAIRRDLFTKIKGRKPRRV
jgi:hypothetical protein